MMFFAEYSNAALGVIKTELHFVSAVYKSARSDGMLTDIVASLGILALARKSQDRSLLLAADSKYSGALKQTQSALANMATAKSDETLATISLLALHEVSHALLITVGKGMLRLEPIKSSLLVIIHTTLSRAVFT